MPDSANAAQDALDTINASFDRLRATIVDLDAAALATPSVVGHWSPKDVIAHVAYWSDLDARQVEAEAQGLPEPGAGEDWQVVNEREYALRRDWSAERGTRCPRHGAHADDGCARTAYRPHRRARARHLGALRRAWRTAPRLA